MAILRALKLGTRRSALARAQSGAIARRLEHLHPGLSVELVGIDTRGDRILDQPLSKVEGKEFFTAEIDAALLSGSVDLTVHSYKDLSLERDSRLLLAAVPRREQARDLVLFTPDVLARIAAGEPLRIGSSSPRRASFVPQFLQRVLPRVGGALPRVVLTELRGNVDSRLRRLHEPRDSSRHLDAVVLAFAGLARLFADAAGHALLAELLPPLPRMVLPLDACPGAPAQGALAIECRRDDAETATLLAAIDDGPTRRAVDTERALLAQRGGGCHQRFGATQFELSGLGTLLQWREEQADGSSGGALRWTPEPALPSAGASVRAWDGTRVASGPGQPLPDASAQLQRRLGDARAVFVAHRQALPEGAESLLAGWPIWVPGTTTWEALAARGLWVQGCAEGFGFSALEPLLVEPLLALPPAGQDAWLVLTHQQAAREWGANALATYRSATQAAGSDDLPPAHTTHFYWHSSAQFERYRHMIDPTAAHGCGPGRTYEHLHRAEVQNLRMFPSVAQWREWLGL